jgi:hypothetical protein
LATQEYAEESSHDTSKPDYRERLFYDGPNVALTRDSGAVYVENYGTGSTDKLGEPSDLTAGEVLEKAARESLELEEIFQITGLKSYESS